MSAEERLFTGALTALFTAAAVGFGFETGQLISETFRWASGPYGGADDVFFGSAISIASLGITLLAAAGVAWMGKKTIHPD